MNRRNSDYILKYNPRKRFPLVDDKLKTKRLALEAGIAVPPLYQIIEYEYQIKKLDSLLAPYQDFVIKPAHGTGGEGIIVITDRILNHYRQINGRLLSKQEISYHLSRLLSGAYSLGGHADYALIEHRVIVDSVFQAVNYEGVPDIRVITLLGYPVMAMARLPTRNSEGKANLHLGAVGIGINLNTGQTTHGVFQNHLIDFHPDTLAPVTGIVIPHWNKILHIAASCYELTGLGYLGIDIVLDKDQGPLMLELNARPGLNIQLANREGGLKRYQHIEARAEKMKESVEERVIYAKQLAYQVNQ